MRTISFLNIKGGVGKTTCSFNIAVGLADKGNRVLLIDLDPQGNTSSIFMGENPELSITELMRGVWDNADIKTMDVAKKVSDNLWLIPSTLELSILDTQLKLDSLKPQHNVLERILRQVADDFDYCIIDSGPIMNLLAVNAIIASNLLVIPIKPDKFAISGFTITVKTINEIKQNFSLDLDYKILFTIVNRNNDERDIIAAVRSLVGNKKVFSSQIRNQAKAVVAASTNNKLVIRDSAGVSQDLLNVVSELEEGFINGAK